MRKTLVSFLISIIIFSCGQKKSNATEKTVVARDLKALLRESIPKITDRSKIKRFVMIVAPRAFRDEEFKIPYEFLTSIGHKIRVASRDTVLATGIMGLAIKPQLTIKQIDTLSYDGLILVGGVGAAIYWNDTIVHKIVRYYERTPGKIVSAICIAPVTLARAGVLAGKKATVYESRETIKELKDNGAIYEKSDVVICGNVITASGPSEALKFAKAIALSVNRKQ